MWLSGFNGLIGLDFTQIKSISEISGITLDEKTMRHLQIIEAERLKAVKKDG